MTTSTEAPASEAATFAHTLYILPPIQQQDGSTEWWGYLDSPDSWRRSFPALADLVAAAGLIVSRLWVWERVPPSGPNPTKLGRPPRATPEATPEWQVRISASFHPRPQWVFELADDSMWSVTDYEIRSCQSALLRHLTRRAEMIDPITEESLQMTHAPLAVVPPTRADQPVQSFDSMMAPHLARVERQLEQERRAVAEAQERIAVLTRERKALQVALAAYTRAADPVPRDPAKRTPPLTTDQVRTIRELGVGGRTCSDIAEVFGLTNETVRRVLSGQSYRNVP